MSIQFTRIKKIICVGDFNFSLLLFHIAKPLEQFEKRFQHFIIIKPMVALFVIPCTCQLEVEKWRQLIGCHTQIRRERVELEILDFQNYTVLKSCATDDNFWKLND